MDEKAMTEHVMLLNRLQKGLRSNLKNVLSLDQYVNITEANFDLNIKNFLWNLSSDNKTHLYINQDIIEWCGYDLNIDDFINILNINDAKYIKTNFIENNVKILNSNFCLTKDNDHIIMEIDEFKKFTMSMNTLKGNSVNIYYLRLKDMLIEYNTYVAEFKKRSKVLKKYKYIN
jgi:MSV199 domain